MVVFENAMWRGNPTPGHSRGMRGKGSLRAYRRVARPGAFFADLAFFSTLTFQAVRRAPASTSSLALARWMWVMPIFPQPPRIGRNTPGSSRTNSACCSGVSIRFPYPWSCEASVAKILPPTRKSGEPMCAHSSAPSRLSAMRRKSAAFMGSVLVERYSTTVLAKTRQGIFRWSAAARAFTPAQEFVDAGHESHQLFGILFLLCQGTQLLPTCGAVHNGRCSNAASTFPQIRAELGDQET